MVVAAEAGVHPPPTESDDAGTNAGNNDDSGTGQPPSGGEDKLLLAMCRTIRKETGWQERTLRQACDWATGASSGWRNHAASASTFFGSSLVALCCCCRLIAILCERVACPQILRQPPEHE